MLPTDHALVRDAKLRMHAEKYAVDRPAFFRDFAAAWSTLQELGCDGLVPHPASLTYASACVLPCEWVDLRLITRREHTHDTTIYGFALPKQQPLGLPVCGSVQVKAPRWGPHRRAKDE